MTPGVTHSRPTATSHTTRQLATHNHIVRITAARATVAAATPARSCAPLLVSVTRRFYLPKLFLETIHRAIGPDQEAAALRVRARRSTTTMVRSWKVND